MALIQHPEFSNLILVQHPLLNSLLTEMRRKETETPNERFFHFMGQLAPSLVFSVLEDLEETTVPIETPVGPMPNAPTLASRKLMLVSILGAGQGFLDGLRKRLLPWASEAYISARRDHNTLEPTLTYSRMPETLAGWLVLALDPMLATGGSASAAIELIKQINGDCRIRLVCLVAAPDGVSRMLQDHAEVTIYTVALDPRLTEKGYIDPGLGDAGDRLTGTTPE